MKEVFVDLDFLKSLKRGQFVLIAYSGNAICSKPELAKVTQITKSWITLEGIRENGTTWQTGVNKQGFSHNKNDTWCKFIAPLSDLFKVTKLVNKHRRISNKKDFFTKKEMLSVAKFKQECFDAIAAYQLQQNQETN